jgi:restriction endonuclease
MPYLRPSRARFPYQCAICSQAIPKGQKYVRQEPHAFEYIRGHRTVRQLCLNCAVPDRPFPPDPSEDPEVLAAKAAQLQLRFASPDEILEIPARVAIVDITAQLLALLASDPDLIRTLGPDLFEELVLDRLSTLGFDVKRVGSGTFGKDGGIDFLAWPRRSPLPFLMAVQAKHTANRERKVGPAPVRDLLGTVQAHGLNAGLLVTNSTFSPDARWFAKQRPLLLRLRDIHDLARWLQGSVADEEWRDIPRRIELSPGVVVEIPKVASSSDSERKRGNK